MRDSIIRLFPLPNVELPLKGLYLSHNLRDKKRDSGESFVYSNYVTSLDGRIAVPHPTKAGMVVPDQITNPRDWRLFQELAVQADILITSGRYLRDYAEGRAQEILRVYDDPQFTDLKDWRTERALSPQPDLAVISGSMDFPVPPGLIQGDRKIVVITTSRAAPGRIEKLESQTGKVIIAGEGSVNGFRLVQSLLEMGYRIIYNTTGPKVMHLLLAAGVLDRLYLSFVNRLLGGSPFSSIVEGGLLEPPADFILNTIHLDPHALDGLGQLLTSYNRA
ncbi:RibD family protein [Chloroflexota bacterium]